MGVGIDQMGVTWSNGHGLGKWAWPYQRVGLDQMGVWPGQMGMDWYYKWVWNNQLGVWPDQMGVT